MGESRRPNRIEIELTSNDDAPGWERPPGPGTGDGDHAAERSDAVVAHGVSVDHPRIWGTVAIVVAALALGWLLGRSAPGNNDSATEATETTQSSTTTTEPVEQPITAVEPVVTTVAPAPAVIAEPPSIDETTIEFVDVHESVADMGIEIVALGSGRRVITLDLQTRALETQVIDAQPFGPPTLFTGDGWLVLPSWDEDLESTVLRDGADPERVDLGPAWRLLSSPGSGVIWRSDIELFGDVVGRSEQIGPEGEPLGVAVELPTAPLVTDPAGGLVVEVPGGVFQVVPDGATRITSGGLAALGRDRALAYECDDSLLCGYVVVERATGVSSPLPLDPVLGEQPLLSTTWTPTSGSAFSPDGGEVVVEWVDPNRGFRSTLVVIDVETGAFVEVAASPEPIPYQWSPSDDLLFYVYGGRLSVLDLATGTSNAVVSDLVAVETFTLSSVADGR